jgi:hypothetical protein
VEAQVPGPGWYDDGTGQTRWWDGAAWTQHVAPVAEPVVESAPAAPEAAPEPAAAAPAEPLRPGAADPVRSAAADPRPSLPAEDRAPQVPVTEQTFVPASFLTEQTFAPQMAYAGGSPAAASPPGGSLLHHTPEPAAVPAAGASRFGGVGAPARTGMAGIEHTKVVESSGRGRGWLIALIVVAVLAVIGLTAWRIFGPDDKPKATPEVVAAALQSAAPDGELPRGFTPAGDIGGFKVLKSCSTGGSCRTVQIAARSTCKRLSALVLFASTTGNRLGSDVVVAKNVKAGKPATLQAVISAGGGTTVRVSSVVCQQF